MVALWAKRMLTVTKLPIEVMYTGVDATALLRRLDPSDKQLHLRRVRIVNGGHRQDQPWYRYVHTKLQAWSLPCEQVAFIDYDTVPLRPFDQVFSLCGAAPLCGTLDQVTPKQKGLRLINAGLMVVRTNATLHRELVGQAEDEKRAGTKRLYAEQEFLIQNFPDWKELPQEYNIPQHVSRQYKPPKGSRPSDGEAMLNRGYLLHDKLALMPVSLARFERTKRRASV